MSRQSASPPRAIAPMQLGWREYAIVAVIILFVLPVVIWLVLPAEIAEFYYLAVRAPELEEEFGFQSGQIRFLDDDGQTREAFGILSIDEGGRLQKAGFRAGDVISKGYGRPVLQLYGGLSLVQAGDSARIVVLRQSGDELQHFHLVVRPRNAGSPKEPDASR